MKYTEKFKELTSPYKEPVLDIGGGRINFLERLGVKKGIVLDIKFNWQQEGISNLYCDLTKGFKLTRQFPTIFLFEVLEHIKNPLYLMAEVYDLLTDDGVCYIAIPYTKLKPKHKEHVCRWTLKELKNQMEKLGFKVNVLIKKRRFKNKGFWLPHCFLVLELKKEDLK